MCFSISSKDAAAATILQSIMGSCSSIAYVNNTATSKVAEAVEKSAQLPAAVSQVGVYYMTTYV